VKTQRITAIADPSPCEPQAELNVPRVVGGGNDAGRHVVDVAVGLSEVRVVEQIENLGAEFEVRRTEWESACSPRNPPAWSRPDQRIRPTVP
jgi:hypothetical protein